jgi:sulfide:quinone oxidoreductase
MSIDASLGMDGKVSRRTVLRSGAALGVVTLAAPAAGGAVLPKILIVGAGAAGLATAAHLRRKLPQTRITLVDPRERHVYAPGLSLFASGLRRSESLLSETADWVPAEVSYVREAAVAIDADRRRVVTDAGRALGYDILILALGAEPAWEAIDGLDRDRMGEGGVGSLYAGFEAAERTARLISAYADAGGVGLFATATAVQRHAAPALELLLMLDYRMRRSGTRHVAELCLAFEDAQVVTPAPAADRIAALCADRSATLAPGHRLRVIDAEARRAVFATASGEVERDYDLLMVAPPLVAPSVIRRSGLAETSGPWMAADPGTLRHSAWREIYAVGDCAGLERGGTVGSLRAQVRVIGDQIAAELEARPSTALYEGYRAMPVMTGGGRAILIESDDAGAIIDPLPGVVTPGEEAWITRMMREEMTEAAYFALLRGDGLDGPMWREASPIDVVPDV